MRAWVAALAGLGVGVLVGGALVARDGASPAAAPPRATAQEPAPADAGVFLDATARERLGLEVARVRTARVAEEVEGFARVLDPAPLVAARGERDAARSAAEASEAERRRLAALRDGDHSVAAKDLEAARAAAERDRAAAEAAQARLVRDFGSALAGPGNGVVRRLAAGDAALVRVDLPLGTALPSSPRAARLARFDAPARFVEAAPLGPAPVADPTMPGRAWLFVLDRDPPVPGTPLLARVVYGPEPVPRPWVPDAALLQRGDGYLVFVEAEPGRFVPRRVTPGPARDGGRVIEAGLRPGERVVRRGVQELLAEAQGFGRVE